MSRVPEETTGYIDFPRSGTVAPGRNLTAVGWALDSEGPVSTGLLLVDGQRTSSLRTGLPRPDLAALFPDVPRSGWAGWEAPIDLRRAAGPTVRISLLAPGLGGNWIELDRSELRIDQARSLGGRRRGAVFTIAQNEATFLPLWLSYYGRHFDPSDIYLLDHDSSDGSTEGIEKQCNVVAVHRDKSFDHVWLKSTVEEFQAFLLGSYDAVLFSEVDEFVLPDPLRHDGLGDYIEGLEGPAACCTGYNVVHYPDDGEPPLRFEEPLLPQRSYWHPSSRYSKRLLGRVPLSWTTGFHTESNVPEVLPDPDLYLVHLHRIDYEYCLARHQAAAERDWNSDDIRHNLGWQNRVVEPEEFRSWFFEGEDLEQSERELIPDQVREAL
jgi:hypothetical protein